MAKAKYLCDAALTDVKSFANPRLVIITNSGFNPIDPSTWTEPTDYATTNRLSLSGELTGAISTGGTSPSQYRQFTFPTQNKDYAAAVVNTFTSRAIAIVDGTSALTADTPARCVQDSDFTDRAWSAGEIPRLAANAYTCRES